MSTRRNANVDRSHRDGRRRNFLRTTGVRLRRVFFSCVTARREDTTEPDNRPAARQEETTDRRQGDPNAETRRQAGGEEPRPEEGGEEPRPEEGGEEPRPVPATEGGGEEPRQEGGGEEPRPVPGTEEWREEPRPLPGTEEGREEHRLVPGTEEGGEEPRPVPGMEELNENDDDPVENISSQHATGSEAAAQPQQTEQATSEQTDNNGATANDQMMLPVEADSEPRVRRDRTREYVSTQQIHPWQQQPTDMTESGDTTTPDDEPGYDGDAEGEQERWEAGSAGSLDTQLPYLPDLESVQEAGHGSGSQIGEAIEQASSTGDSSQTRSVKGQAGAKMSIPSGEARSAADSDPQAPVPVEGALEPGVDGALEGAVNSRTEDENESFATDDRKFIYGLAYHRQTDRAYLLMMSNSRIQLCKMMTQGGWEIELSLKVHDALDSVYQEDAHIATSSDFIVVRTEAKMTVFDQHVFKVSGPKELSQTADSITAMAGTNDSVYCLLDNGDVLEYLVPELELVRVVTPPGQTPDYKAKQIVFCPDTRRVAISTYQVTDQNSALVNIFDEDWELYVSVVVPSEYVLYRYVRALCLSGDELVVAGASTDHRSVYYRINYSSSVAAQTYSESSLNLIAICPMGEDQFLVASNEDIRRVNLRELRQKMTPCPRSDGIITVRSDLPEAEVTEYIEYDSSRHNNIRSIALNKASGELLEISANGQVAVYSRDTSRPLHTFTLPIPDGAEVSRFDTTEEGEVVAIGDKGQLMIFSPDRQLSWSTDLGEAALDVVCNGDYIYVLLQDEIIIYTLYTNEGRRRTQEGRRLPLFRDQNKLPGHRSLRLAVHEQLVYVIDRTRIFRMNLTNPNPSCTPFRISEPRLEPSGLAVTREGEVVMSGWWEEESAVDREEEASVNREEEAAETREEEAAETRKEEAAETREEEEVVVSGYWKAWDHRDFDSDSDTDSFLSTVSTVVPWSLLVIFSPDGKLRRRVEIPNSFSNITALVPCPGGGIYYYIDNHNLHFLEDF